MKFTFRIGRKASAMLLGVTVFATGLVQAQDYGVMSLLDVVSSAQALLQRGDYRGAVAPLTEAIKRTETITDPDKVEICQTCRFQLARSYYKLGDYAAGMSLLETYVTKTPRKQERMALRMMAQGMFDSKDWDKIADLSKRLLMMQDLTESDRLNANLMLGQALFQKQEWEKCVVPLTYAANKTDDKKTREAVEVMVLRALVESQQWDNLWNWIPRVYNTDAKYDIVLNLTVMEAGRKCYDDEALLQALLMYRMVLPRKVLIDFTNNRIAQYSKSLEIDMKVGIDKMEEGERKKELEQLRSTVGEIEKLPAYEDEVAYRMGDIYRQIKRYWEGYVLFDKLYRDDPLGDFGSIAVLQLVQTLYDLEQVERAEVFIMEYLKKYPSGPSARQMMTIMMSKNLQPLKENPAVVVGLRPNVDTLKPTDDTEALGIEAELHYMLAFGYFLMRDFEQSAEQFSIVISQFPDSHLVSDCYYYRGMTYMMQANYITATIDFDAYLKKYPNKELIPDCKFRRAVCLYGSGDINDAETAFTAFIEEYPNHDFISEAYSMRGDIEAAKDGQDDPNTPDIDESDPETLDRALLDYREAMKRAVNANQADYAAFQAAQVFKLESRWQEIIDLMEDYNQKRGEEADLAESGFWIGQAQIAMKQYKEAVSSYLDIIEDFGNNVQQEGVDKIVRELVTLAEQRLSSEERDALRAQLEYTLDALPDTKPTLKIRMQMATAYMYKEGAVIEKLGADFLENQQDLSMVPPIALALMCDTALRQGDMEMIGTLYDYFITTYEESESLWRAYRAKAFQLMAQQDFDGALEIVQKALDFYGADANMGWAQQWKGDLLYRMKKYEEAKVEYELITTVSEWRGELYARAHMGIARCELALERLPEAAAMFRRTYGLFKAYDNGRVAAEAYVEAAKTLEKMGLLDDMKLTLENMLNDIYVKDLPQAEVAREMLKKYGNVKND